MSAVNSIAFLSGWTFSFLPGFRPRFSAGRSRFLLIIVWSLISPGASSEILADIRNRDVRVIQSSQQSLVFEYIPDYREPEVIRSGTAEYRLFDFAGSVVRLRPEDSGRPDLRWREVSVGFPSEEGNVVQVIAADYEDIPNVVVAPIPQLGLHEGIPGIQSYEVDRDAYSGSGFLPEETVALAEVGRVRSMIVGSVRIAPVRYDPARQTIRRYSRIVVEVVFASPRLPRVGSNDDALLGDVLLNRDIARGWQFASPSTTRKGAPTVLASGPWYRIPVTSEGVFIIDALYLRAIGIEPADIDPRTLKIFGNGGAMVPEMISTPRAVGKSNG